MASTVLDDHEILQRTMQLIKFLAQVTDQANRNPIRDVQASSSCTVLWADDLPGEVDLRLDADVDEAILKLAQVRPVATPPLPLDLVGRVLGEYLLDLENEPRLASLEAEELASEDYGSMREEFDSWLRGWREWAGGERSRQHRRKVYEQFEEMARAMEQRDDADECVIATGLVCWRAEDDTAIRRHLLTELVRPTIDRRTAEVHVVRIGSRRRLEDAQIFDGQECFAPGRARGPRELILSLDDPFGSAAIEQALRDWSGLGLTVPCQWTESCPAAGVELSSTVELSASTAFIVRPRSQALVAEAYWRIADELDAPDAAVPIGLAQLVVETERPQRDAWLANQGATDGDLLGADPLFPLAANAEQRRVLELLRTETGVVVQGPPGTGKTHTIANLVSALLASGQRVLVTSQKDQALKLLRDKIPEEIRHLCVLLAGGTRGAAAELRRGLDAFAAAYASAQRWQLNLDVARLAVERDGLRRRLAIVNEEVARLREMENEIHGPVVPRFTTAEYRGSLAQIVRDVQRHAPKCDWMPEIPAGSPAIPPLDVEELRDVIRVARLPLAVVAARPAQFIPEPRDVPDPSSVERLLTDWNQARSAVPASPSELAEELTRLGSPELDRLVEFDRAARRLLASCGLSTSQDDNTARAPEWVKRAVVERLTGRSRGIWRDVHAVRGEPEELQGRLQARGLRQEVEIPIVDRSNVGAAKGWLNAGHDLLGHVRAGGRLNGWFPGRAQRAARSFLAEVRVDGASPRTADQLEAAVVHLGAAVAAVQIAQKWLVAGVPVADGPLPVLLSDLADKSVLLDRVEELGSIYDAAAALVAGAGVVADLSTVGGLQRVAEAALVAARLTGLKRATAELEAVRAAISDLAAVPRACPELVRLLRAASARDGKAYAAAASDIARARRAQAALIRGIERFRVLDDAHPALARLVAETAHDDVWDVRSADFPAA